LVITGRLFNVNRLTTDEQEAWCSELTNTVRYYYYSETPTELSN
jgi:hypothetical protein